MKKYILPALTLITFDFLTKSIILSLLVGQFVLTGYFIDLVPNPVLIDKVSSFFNIVFTWNPGTSFSMFQSVGETHQIVVTLCIFLIIAFLVHFWVSRKNTQFEHISLLLVVSGAIGNFIDRLRFGAVIDFLDFHIGIYHWPAFNVADIMICCGVGIYIYHLLKKNKK